MVRFQKQPVFACLAFLFISLALACGGGGGGGSAPPPAPTITSFTPDSGHAGDDVAITGTNFTGATQVAFGGVPASSFSVNSSTEISTTVPSGAISGTISVTAPGGTATSSSDFTVLPPPPTISSLYPSHAKIGDSITITGTHFEQVSHVGFGSVITTAFTVVSSTQITVWVPTSATTGPVSVTTAGGTGSSATAFTVDPAITGFNPTQGPVNTNVIIKGTGFTSSTTVAFNGTVTPDVTLVSSTELQAVAPSGATTGKVTVAGDLATAASSTAFTVTSGGSTLDLFRDGWYITQSTQDYPGSVPLVANRDGFLRVFVRANEANAETPTVRVTINGTPTDLAAPSGVTSTTGVPTSIDEGNVDTSWNLAIPGASIHAGMTVSIEIDPDGLISEADETDNTMSATLDTSSVRVFHATLVPVVQKGLTGRVDTEGRTPTTWVDRFQRMYPVRNAGIDAVKGSTYTFTGTLDAGGAGWDTLLSNINAKRTAEGSTRYYYGAVNVDYDSGQAGLGYIGHPVAIGWDKTGYSDGGNYPEVYAHEVGHNLGRWHAPCVEYGTISGVDPDWPSDPVYASASIGVYGYDVANHILKSPGTYKDIMSYCSPLWVSDYMYKGIMDYRASSPIGDVVGGAAEARECLLVSGRVRNGQVILEPSFRVWTVPQPPAPGSYVLQLQDADGAVAREISFEPMEIADLPGGLEKHFVFAIPLESPLGGLRVMKAGVPKAVVAPSLTAARMIGVREPVSVRMRAGEAHLSWDPMAHPKVMVRDPRTGEVLSFADGGSLDVVTDAPELDVTFSDGVNSTRKILKVQ